jgi:hypothetical protein
MFESRDLGHKAEMQKCILHSFACPTGPIEMAGKTTLQLLAKTIFLNP